MQPLRVPIAVEFQEDIESGVIEPYAEAQFNGLDPCVSYRISVEVKKSRDIGGRAATSTEVVIPQRSKPARWTPQEVMLWCTSLKVADLARKVKDYAVDGTTLLSFSEEDL